MFVHDLPPFSGLIIDLRLTGIPRQAPVTGSSHRAIRAGLAITNQGAKVLVGDDDEQLAR